MTRDRVIRSRSLGAILLTVVVAVGSSVGAAAPAAAGTHAGFQGPIYFSAGGIERINPDGSGRQQLVPFTFTQSNGGAPDITYSRPEHPAISPDGRTLAFSVEAVERNPPYGDFNHGRVLFYMDVNVPGSYRALEGHTAVGDQFPDLIRGASPSWAPDGTALVFTRERAGDHLENPNDYSVDLWLLRIDGGRPSRLTVSPEDYWAEDPEWSPNGRWIAFGLSNGVAFDGGTSDLRLVDPLNGANQHVLEVLPARSLGPAPSWRPDSARIVYSFDGAGLYTVAIDANGNRTSRSRVFGSTPADRDPVYAPSNDAGTQGDTIVTTRGSDQFWFLRGTEHAGSERGPITGGRGTSWSRAVVVPQRPTQTAPVRPTVSPIVEAARDAIADPCSFDIASCPVLDPGGTIIIQPPPIIERVDGLAPPPPIIEEALLPRIPVPDSAWTGG